MCNTIYSDIDILDVLPPAQALPTIGQNMDLSRQFTSGGRDTHSLSNTMVSNRFLARFLAN